MQEVASVALIYSDHKTADFEMARTLNRKSAPSSALYEPDITWHQSQFAFSGFVLHIKHSAEESPEA